MSEQDIERLTNFLRTIVTGLVDDEGSVSVEVIAERMHTNLQVQVGPRDFGKVVGRHGHNAEAIRLLVKAAGHKLGLPACIVHVEDPNPKLRGRSQRGYRTR